MKIGFKNQIHGHILLKKQHAVSFVAPADINTFNIQWPSGFQRGPCNRQPRPDNLGILWNNRSKIK